MTRPHDGIVHHQGQMWLYWLVPGSDPRQFPPTVQQLGTPARADAGPELAEAIAADVERQRAKREGLA